jgi:acetylglutamate kinase
MVMQPLVIKYGGAALRSHPERGAARLSARAEKGQSDPVLGEIAQLHKEGVPVVLVHGGGPEIDQALAQRGIVTQRIAGHRVSDAATLEVVESVLCATINKRLVRSLLELGVRAAGISGQDGPTLIAEKARGDNDTDLGFVGEIVDCDAALVQTLLDAQTIPVVAPLAISRDGTQTYNVNADLAAAAVAAALKACAFIVVTNVPRVLRDADDPDSGIQALTVREARAFARTDGCRSSMKPKVLAAAAAISGGAKRAFICEGKAGAIASALSGDATVIGQSTDALGEGREYLTSN